MKAELISKAYEVAKERYAEIGVDTEKVLKQLQDFHLSLHCWQADDVKGFEVQAGAMSGGIQSLVQHAISTNSVRTSSRQSLLSLVTTASTFTKSTATSRER